MSRLLPVLLLLAPALARGQSVTETCVEVVTRRTDADELRRLVIDELDRHATHRAAEQGGDAGCQSWLRVELIDLPEGRWLTGRINTQVPHRVRIEGDALADALTELLRVVLHNDPVRLRGPREQGWFREALHSLRAGRNLYGAEAYQLGGIVDGGLSTIPGIAISFRREVDQWHLGARISFGWHLGDRGSDLDLTGHAGAQLQLAWFFLESADVSPYVAGLLGLEHQRYHGPSPLAGGAREAYDATGFGLGLRTGVELFRTTTARLDLFTQAVLPAFVASDDDNAVIDAWVPTFSLGAGMLF